jgi:hypothetical protein
MKINYLEQATKIFANLSIYAVLLLIYSFIRNLEDLNLGPLGVEIFEIMLNVFIPTCIIGSFIFYFLYGKSQFKLNYRLIFVLLILTISIFEFVL